MLNPMLLAMDAGVASIVGPIIIIVLIIIFLAVLFSFVPMKLWIEAMASGVRVGIGQLIGMRLRGIAPVRIIYPMIKAVKAGLTVQLPRLETHYMAGGQRRPRGECADCLPGRRD